MPTWQFVSRTFGLAILVVVLVEWGLGLNISEPGMLMLLGIAASLLTLDVSATVRRVANGRSSGSQSKQPPLSPPSLPSDTD